LKAKRERLDKRLVAQGLAPTRERAQAYIIAGKVRVDGEIVTKAGQAVAPEQAIELIEPDHPYVSRGGLKLAHALDHFAINPNGMVAIDIGASTGGFTDVLLQRGARKVFAIDSGTNQLDWRLRSDARVVVMEQTNARYLEAQALGEPCDLAVVDVSFISLTLLLLPIAAVLGAQKPIVCLVKPQFEVGKGEVGKGGIVRDPALRQAAVDKVRTFAREHGFAVGAAIESPIQGTTGNVEYLLLLHTP
jgi:23S rRNA (cytidine1920-2'-O)/16S rRNA (cytidine1409-2'-O)-methyltransferase